MARYRKKPVVIEAFCYNVDPRPDWFMDRVSDLSIITHKEFCQIATLEGEFCGQKGDYIIQGVQGEIYPCKADIFAQTYEPVDEEE